MTSLFDIEAYNAPKIPVQDPYWDEIVLEPNPAPESTGQLTLFYDSSQEPPDPDDFSSIHEYDRAWEEWQNKYPGLLPEAKICDPQYKSVGEQVKQTTKYLSQGSSLEQKSTEQVNKGTAHQHANFVERYYVTRSGKKFYYYRYTSMDSSRVFDRCYIGSIRSATAITIASMVREKISEGLTASEIKSFIADAKKSFCQ